MNNQGVTTAGCIVKPTRRLILTGLAAGIVAPCIVRADSLMDINRLGNRLVIGYRHRYISPDSIWSMSLINKVDDYTSDIFRLWRMEHPFNDYELKRRDEIGFIPSGFNKIKIRVTERGWEKRYDDGCVVGSNWTEFKNSL